MYHERSIVRILCSIYWDINTNPCTIKFSSTLFSSFIISTFCQLVFILLCFFFVAKIVPILNDIINIKFENLNSKQNVVTLGHNFIVPFWHWSTVFIVSNVTPWHNIQFLTNLEVSFGFHKKFHTIIQAMGSNKTTQQTIAIGI